MELFVGVIPHNATLQDLMLFAGPFAEDVRIDLIKHDKVDAPSVCYGLLRVPSERQARKAIRKLNGRELAGQKVAVREFSHRAYSNDRRAINWRSQPWSAYERRLCDRRISDQVEEVTASQEFRNRLGAQA